MPINKLNASRYIDYTVLYYTNIKFTYFIPIQIMDEHVMAQQRKWFITFGGPTENYHNAVSRLCGEADALGVFDRIIGYTEKDIMDDEEFWNKHQESILSNERGYGYWIWKSYLTKKTLEMMADNDIVVYLDAGCKINPHGKPRLLEYFDIVNQSKFANFAIHMPEHLEKTWTKMDIIHYYNANRPEILETGQLISGIYILRKCQHTIDIIDRWYEGSCIYHFPDDSPSSISNDPSFIENRHDQSLFSVLRKIYGTEMTTFDETWFDPDWYNSGIAYPFWAVRMRY